MSYFGVLRDKIAFSTTALLGNGITYDSGILHLGDYHQVQTHILSDKNGTIVVYFLQDEAGSDILRTLTVPYVGGSGYKLFSAPAFTPYVKYTFTCTEVGQSDFYFDTKFLTTALSGQVLGLTDFIAPNMTANLGRNIIVGQTDGGLYKNVPITSEGHLEVALHSPRLPFGSIHTEKITPIFQADAVYELNSGQLSWGSTISGSVFTSQSMFVASTGTGIYSQAFFQSRKRLRYRPGQGVVSRFTAKFTPGVDNSYQVAGIGHSEDGVYFAYSGSAYGILYTRYGVREQQYLSITAGSTANQTASIILNSVSQSVTVSDSGLARQTAWEISQGTYNGWKAQPSGSGVLFIADSVGNRAGAFSISGSGISATFSELTAGETATETFISQSQWNGDTLDGTGPSGGVIDPTKGNVYQIGMQYLGFGPIIFQAEVTPDGNNTEWVTVHTIDYNNQNERTSFGNPSFPFSVAAYSAGSVSDLQVKVGSFSGFIEGDKVLNGNRYSYNNAISSISTTQITPVFTILNSRRFGTKSNQSVVNILSFTFGARLSNNAYGQVLLIKNGNLSTTPDFLPYDSNSCTLYDTGSTIVSYTENKQVILSFPLVETSQQSYQFTEELDLQPGEWLTAAAILRSGTATFLEVSVNTIEDQ